MKHPRVSRRCAWAVLICLVPPLASCGTRTGLYESAQHADRNPVEAERLSREAAAILADDPDKAESLLRRALTLDLYCGPAHNNLGVLLLSRGDLYGASSEFEWARKLMPGHPDPRLNLALTLDRAGRPNDAILACRAALDVAPEHMPSMQKLAELQIRHGQTDTQTPRLLAEIALRGEDEKWRIWAVRQSLRAR